MQPSFDMSRRIPEDEFDRFKARDGTAENEGLQILADFSALDDIYHNMVSPTYFNEISHDSQLMIKPVEEKAYAFPSASLKILRRCCRSKASMLAARDIKLESPSTSLLANDIIELAASFFVHSNSEKRHHLFTIRHPYATTENAKDIQLVQDLLLCADKVSNQDYDSAIKILQGCQNLCSIRANVVQRLVYYFTEALCDKIERETGNSIGKSMLNSWPLEAAMAPSSALAAFHEKMPFSQVTQFTSIQLMTDHVEGSRKIHIIDLEVYSGLHYSILMQTIADRSECRLLHLKITAVVSYSDVLTEEAGILLRTLAETLNLSFSFSTITLHDFCNLEIINSDLDPEETVIVHAAYALKHMIVKPVQLESLMKVIKNSNPSVMIIHEVEAKVNSPVFVDRFVEALFFYGAYFDCMEDFLKNDVEVRNFAESELFSPPLRNSVAAEGDERKCRSVSVDVWRAFFGRFGMVETELSTLALDNANLVLQRFDCKDSCTLSLNGKCLIVSWKDSPICSISAWKFRKTLSIRKRTT